MEAICSFETAVYFQALLATCFLVGFLLGLFFDLKKEAICSSETSVDFQALLATCFQIGLLLGLFFDPEGGDMFLRNVG
jgi:hypothetical protein